MQSLLKLSKICRDLSFYTTRVQNKEMKVHGQMAEYFNKRLAIYKSVWPFYIILWIWCTKY